MFLEAFWSSAFCIYRLECSCINSAHAISNIVCHHLSWNCHELFSSLGPILSWKHSKIGQRTISTIFLIWLTPLSARISKTDGWTFGSEIDVFSTKFGTEIDHVPEDTLRKWGECSCSSKLHVILCWNKETWIHLQKTFLSVYAQCALSHFPATSTVLPNPFSQV